MKFIELKDNFNNVNEPVIINTKYIIGIDFFPIIPKKYKKRCFNQGIVINMINNANIELLYNDFDDFIFTKNELMKSLNVRNVHHNFTSDYIVETSNALIITDEIIDDVIENECIKLTTHDAFYSKYGDYLTPDCYKEIPDTAFLFPVNDKWIAIDNSSYECWTEEFDTKVEAVKWLIER